MKQRLGLERGVEISGLLDQGEVRDEERRGDQMLA